MSTLGERKCAVLLASLNTRDRRRMLAQLPQVSTRNIRTLLAELESMPFPVQSLADELLADEMLGLTARTSLELEQLVALSRRVPAPWFARVLSVWTGVDRNFCLAVLETDIAERVRRELRQMPELPPKLIQAIKAEAIVMSAAPTQDAA